MRILQVLNPTKTGSLNNRFVIVAIFWTIMVWIIGNAAISQEEKHGINKSREQASSLAVFFEQHTLAIFRYGDAYLKMVRREYLEKRSIDAVQNLMAEVPINNVITSHVTIMDETGTPIMVSGHKIKPGSTAKDRDYFQFQKNASSDQLLISLPHRGRNSGILTIRLVRRLLKPNGEFGGVIFVAIKAEYITEFFNALGLGANSSATLVGTDKKIRARSSYGKLGPGQDISGSRIWREIDKARVGSYLQLSVVDGVTRLYSYRALEEFPLVVAIGVSDEDTLASLNQYKILAYSISTLATILIIITTLLFSRQYSARRQLENSEQHTRTIMDTVLGGIISVDEQCIIESFNRGAIEMFGYKEAEVIGQPLSRLCDPECWDQLEQFLNRQDPQGNQKPGGQGYHETVAIRRNHDTFPAEIAVGKTNRNGKPLLVITIQDTSERKKAALALFASEERAQVTLQSIGDAVISTNALGIVDFLNPIAETLTGWTVEEAKGQPLSEVFKIVNDQTREPARDPVAECLEKGQVIKLKNNTLLISRSGEEYAIEDSAAPIRVDDDSILGVVLVFKDVTEARQLSQEVYYQASHDALTNLINRQEFERRLQRVRETAEMDDSDNVLCFIDLDQFKVVNDTCGHVAGDELLRQITEVMQACVRQRDTLGRLGGDEFGLLMERCSIDEAKRIAMEIIEAVRQYSFAWEEGIFNIGASMGMVGISCGSQNVDELMKAADSACYMAKEKGRNRLQVFVETDENLTRRHGETQWAIRIPRALNENRFELYYQSILDLDQDRNKDDLHYEILLRMIGEDGEIIFPNSFLPAAERYKLATDIDMWVVTHVFEWLRDNSEHLRHLKTCAINLSALSISNESFRSFIIQQFESFDIPPEKICFEITETVAISNLTSATHFIKALKKLGCQLALDDFGSGLSSYAYLKNLPVDFLKIDGVFVKDIMDDKVDLATVKSINEIGHVMGHKTIAEFVENEDILNKLREIGVNYAQGYVIAKPRPLSEMKVVLNKTA